MTNKNKTENVIISESKYILIKKILQNIHDNLGRVVDILEQGPDELANGEGSDMLNGISETLEKVEKDLEVLGDERIVEGVFDGEKMIASDGQEYTVPANYASKSKLVEGDILKLTMTSRGDFLYKQIGPVERQKVIATLNIDKNGNYYAIADKKKWQLLPASVTYYKGETGDEVVILIPKEAKSKWAAVENIVKK